MTLNDFLKELKHKSILFQLNVTSDKTIKEDLNLNNLVYMGDLSSFNYWIHRDKYLSLHIINIIPRKEYLIIRLYKEVIND